jgi:hypothetical protein
MPSKVVVSSSARDALLRMQELDFVILSGVRMVRAGLRVITAGLVAVHFMRKLGIEVELRWILDGREIDGALESNCAACEGAKYESPPKGPDAFIKNVQADYELKRKAKLRRKSELRKKEAKRKNKTREQEATEFLPVRNL